MDEMKIHGILMDALKAANAKCDSDGSTIWIEAGSTIWIEAEGGRTLAVCVSDCAPDEYGISESEKHIYSVSLHATFAGSFDVRASSGSAAEEIVRDRFANEDIKVRDLELDTTEVNATEVD